MNRYRLVTVALAAACLSAPAVYAQTVQELLAANTAARGGQALGGVQSVRQTMTVSLPGADAVVVVHSRRPNLVRQELTVGGETFIQAYDGRVAWERTSLISGSGAVVLTGVRADAIRAQAAFDGLLAEAQAAGRRIDLLGRTTIDGREVHHIRVSERDQVWHCYLDVQTALERRLVQDTIAGRLQQDLSDYRDVGGIRVPFRISTAFNGQQQSVIVVTDVQLNVPIDPQMFDPGPLEGPREGQILN
jgi:hypothetical protein